MKNLSILIPTIFISSLVFLLGFDFRKKVEPNVYYQVYLDEEVIGTIQSKAALEKYIDARNDYAKKKYNVSKIYAPNGLKIKMVNTYDKHLDQVKDVYEKISKKRPFTIKGYQLTIKEEKDSQKLFATDEKVFREALEDTIVTFVGEENYRNFKNDTQSEITATGMYLEDVYIENNMTIRSTNIPITETIYSDSVELAKYLLFGTTEDQGKYIIQPGDTIENVAMNHKISVEEFLISNPEFSSANSLLYAGQEVVIGITDPQLRVVEKQYVVEDKAAKFHTEEQVDPEMTLGVERVIQKGEDGLERISQVRTVSNGIITYAKIDKKEILKPSINQVIIKGTKNVPSVGGAIWDWPTNSGWTISSGYEWRIDPFTGLRAFHTGIDIAGPGEGSPIYAANNGVVYIAEEHWSYGYYVVINHNNGYYTLYAHMMSWPLVKPGEIVSRGQKIGYMGMTGDATGPHLHLEVWTGGAPFEGGYRRSPWIIYPDM